MAYQVFYGMRRPGLFLGLLTAAALFASVPESLAGGDKAIALKAGKVITGGAEDFADGCVVIQGSKIVSVGPVKSLPEGIEVTDFGAAVICPGLIDPCTALGAEKDQSEPATAFQPGARLLDVFDPTHEDFARALQAGITSVLIAPSPENVIGGSAACVKTWGPGRKERILKPEGPVFMTIAPDCFKEDREPTSRMGALELLRGCLREASRSGPDKGKSLLADLTQGRLEGFFMAKDGYDLEAGLELRREFGIRLVLVGAHQADKVLDELKENPVPVVFGPFDFATEERALRAPARVAKSSCPIAFTAGSPARDTAGLRITAALAVQGGLPKEVALKGLTSTAAAVGGIDGRVGTLAPGMDADIAVFSEHPLHLSARVLAVYVNGRQAYRACDSNPDLRGASK